VQSCIYGKFTAYVSKDAIRLDGLKGGRLVAKAPDWDVTVYNTIDKMIVRYTLDRWFKHIEDPQFPVENIGLKPKKTTVCGIPAGYYDFQINKPNDIDNGYGSLYRSTIKQEMVTIRRLVVAADISKLPRQAVEIWRIHDVIPVIGTLPLECYDQYKSGKKIYAIQTFSSKYTTVPADFFTVQAKGYKKGQAPFIVFYGQECGDVGEMMLGEPR
jgi:hypothetical protein